MVVGNIGEHHCHVHQSQEVIYLKHRKFPAFTCSINLRILMYRTVFHTEDTAGFGPWIHIVHEVANKVGP